jgi:hypothetical protein
MRRKARIARFTVIGSRDAPWPAAAGCGRPQGIAAVAFVVCYWGPLLRGIAAVDDDHTACHEACILTRHEQDRSRDVLSTGEVATAASRLTTVLEEPRMKLWVLSHGDTHDNARVRALAQYLALHIPSVLAARQPQ